MNYRRHRLTREQFTTRCLRLEEIYKGNISQTSGVRTAERNKAVGGKGTSHVEGLGRDYVFQKVPALDELYPVCKTLGLWALFHEPAHLHVQGRPPR